MCFAPTLYEDPKAALFKLCRIATVKEYPKQFESLDNRIVDLPSQFYISCFVSSLKPVIRREVQAFQSQTLSQAISLAKLQEEKTLDHYHHTPKHNYPSLSPSQNLYTSIPNPSQISLHALMGHTVPQSLRVIGRINKNPVIILIDSGSTRNFFQDRVAKQLGLTLNPA